MEPGALVVRRSIQIAATPERVWQEFEDPERMKRWWDLDTPNVHQRLVRYEAGVGGWLEIEGLHHGHPFHFGGKIVAFDPPREVTMEHDWMPSQGWTVPTLLTVRLTANGYGTLVEVLHHGFERIGDQALEAFHGFEGGWGIEELDALRRIVEAG
ncbi:MAG: SRPBCC domain-containing protein [Dehalococcoidia bacterium]